MRLRHDRFDVFFRRIGIDLVVDFDAVEAATDYWTVELTSIAKMNEEQLRAMSKNWNRNDHCCETLEDSCIEDYDDLQFEHLKLVHRAEKRRLKEKKHSAKRVKQ